MEARTENMSYINLIKHANPQLLSPSTGCLDKIKQFWPTRPLDTFMTSPDRRDHKVDQVEVALMTALIALVLTCPQISEDWRYKPKV